METNKEYQTELVFKELILEICSVLYRYGYADVSLGAIMRLLGIEDQRASKHDRNYLTLGPEVDTVVHEQEILKATKERMSGSVTLH